MFKCCRINGKEWKGLHRLWALLCKLGLRHRLLLLFCFPWNYWNTYLMAQSHGSLSVLCLTGWRCNRYKHSESGSWNLFCHSCGQNTPVTHRVPQQKSQWWARAYVSAAILFSSSVNYCTISFINSFIHLSVGNTAQKKKYIGVRMLQLSPS